MQIKVHYLLDEITCDHRYTENTVTACEKVDWLFGTRSVQDTTCPDCWSYLVKRIGAARNDQRSSNTTYPRR